MAFNLSHFNEGVLELEAPVQDQYSFGAGIDAGMGGAFNEPVDQKVELSDQTVLIYSMLDQAVQPPPNQDTLPQKQINDYKKKFDIYGGGGTQWWMGLQYQDEPKEGTQHGDHIGLNTMAIHPTHNPLLNAPNNYYPYLKPNIVGYIRGIVD